MFKIDRLIMPRIYVDEDIYYYVESAGEGSPLVMLHGFTGSSQNWRPLSERFKAHLMTIAIDLLGHGESAAPSDTRHYTMPSVARNLMILLQTMTHEPVHLLGYSMGARVALYLALHHPKLVKTLIIESGSPGIDSEDGRKQRRQEDRSLAERIEQRGIESFVGQWEQQPIFLTQQNLPADVRQELRAQRLENSPRGLANSLRGMGTGEQPSLWSQLGEVEVPVLVLCGELDDKFTAISEQMVAQMPNARMEVVPSTGHNIHLENPDGFYEAVMGFLADYD
jgi:2-succinyl-6-hydroxy-2,4-cyclohexadiene-1-carboxylate synthase